MATVRTQVYLTTEQRKRIDDLRARDGRSLAEVVRDALDASGVSAPHPAQLHPLVPLPAEVRAVLHAWGAQRREAATDELIGAFVRGQAGVVARRQLLAVGVTPRAIGGRLARSQLVVRFRGVYAPGHLHLGVHGHRTAAVLAVPGCVLTHGSATALRGIGGESTSWHVTLPGSSGRRRVQQIVVHTSTTLAARDICVVQGLPTTSVARSIVDAASHLRQRQIANLLARAERASLLHVGDVQDVMDRVRARPTPGHARLAAALDEHLQLGAQLSRSDIEGALRDIAARAGLPAPRLNQIVGGDEVDALWPDLRLGIEIDSWQFHHDRRSFVADRAKLRRLYLQGLTVLPFAASDLVYRPAAVAAEIRAILARASAS